MDYIYEVLMFIYNDDTDEVEEWTDSWWTTREAAIKEADTLWDSIGEDSVRNEIRVIRRKLNVSGAALNMWNDACHTRVKYYLQDKELEWDESGKSIVHD